MTCKPCRRTSSSAPWISREPTPRASSAGGTKCVGEHDRIVALLIGRDRDLAAYGKLVALLAAVVCDMSDIGSSLLRDGNVRAASKTPDNYRDTEPPARRTVFQNSLVGEQR